MYVFQKEKKEKEATYRFRLTWEWVENDNFSFKHKTAEWKYFFIQVPWGIISYTSQTPTNGWQSIVYALL